MYEIKYSSRYKKNYKRIESNTTLVEELNTVVSLLIANDNPLPAKYRDHQLTGKYATFRECHVRPDWLLVYQKNKTELILLLIETGTHSQIFA